MLGVTRIVGILRYKIQYETQTEMGL